eukprot:s5726_g4.t1
MRNHEFAHSVILNLQQVLAASLESSKHFRFQSASTAETSEESSSFWWRASLLQSRVREVWDTPHRLTCWAHKEAWLRRVSVAWVQLSGRDTAKISDVQSTNARQAEALPMRFGKIIDPPGHSWTWSPRHL